jgi:uncharacterized damage-inducible protein DinB
MQELKRQLAIIEKKEQDEARKKAEAERKAAEAAASEPQAPWRREMQERVRTPRHTLSHTQQTRLRHRNINTPSLSLGYRTCAY